MRTCVVSHLNTKTTGRMEERERLLGIPQAVEDPGSAWRP